MGDAQAAAGNALDFAVFMFEAGNANGDFEGSTVQALGSEGRTWYLILTTSILTTYDILLTTYYVLLTTDY